MMPLDSMTMNNAVNRRKAMMGFTVNWWVSRWRLVGFSVEIGGLPMSPMMISLKIADDGLDVV